MRAMRTTLTVATEVLPGLPPLLLQLEVEVKAGVYILNCNDKRQPKSGDSDHANMTQNMEKELILQVDMDKMTQKYAYDK
jgi:hypothetical protein